MLIAANDNRQPDIAALAAEVEACRRAVYDCEAGSWEEKVTGKALINALLRQDGERLAMLEDVRSVWGYSISKDQR